ncbi:MAG: hypothetical protein JWQ07_4209 [Ramlibacter sp.]|nr:hypothetical protein [Ramlibacter sp.]
MARPQVCGNPRHFRKAPEATRSRIADIKERLASESGGNRYECVPVLSDWFAGDITLDRMFRYILALATAMFMVAALSACNSKSAADSLAAPSGSTVNITEITPNPAGPMTVGSEVKLRATVAYALTSDSGTLGLVVQDAKNKPLAQIVNVVLKGGGTESLEVSFTVPDTTAIHVFTPLSGQGQGATSTVATRSYRVQSK